jgi:hypothetical protein
VILEFAFVPCPAELRLLFTRAAQEDAVSKEQDSKESDASPETASSVKKVGWFGKLRLAIATIWGLRIAIGYLKRPLSFPPLPLVFRWFLFTASAAVMLSAAMLAVLMCLDSPLLLVALVSAIWVQLWVVELLVTARVLPLEALSYIVITLPFTMPRILNLQLALPAAFKEQLKGNVSSLELPISTQPTPTK